MKNYLIAFSILVFLSITMIVLAEKNQEESKIPQIIKSPSSTGEVTFPHQQHFEEFEFECQTCHHETNATDLKIPHKDYFDDFWIDCNICHHENGATKLEAQACSNCHHDSPINTADETHGAKVVIHKSCWECHEVGTGEEASENCKFCHNGPKK